MEVETSFEGVLGDTYVFRCLDFGLIYYSVCEAFVVNWTFCFISTVALSVGCCFFREHKFFVFLLHYVADVFSAAV